MAEVNDSIKEKIRKLLAKADNTAVSVEEARAFNDKAHELMTRYNLDRAMLGEGKGSKSDVRTHKTLEVLIRPWSSAIMSGLTKLYYCKWYYSQLSTRSHKVTIIGEESNVAVCHAVAVMVLRAVQQEARKTGGGRSFMTGAGDVIYQRCSDMYRATHETLPASTSGPPALLSGAQSNALVVLDQSEAAQNQRYMQEVLNVKSLRQVKSTPRIKSASALEAGRAFGATVNLKGNLLR